MREVIPEKTYSALGYFIPRSDFHPSPPKREICTSTDSGSLCKRARTHELPEQLPAWAVSSHLLVDLLVVCIPRFPLFQHPGVSVRSSRFLKPAPPRGGLSERACLSVSTSLYSIARGSNSDRSQRTNSAVRGYCLHQPVMLLLYHPTKIIVAESARSPPTR